MKTKHLFLTAILLVFSVLVVAGPVDPARALKVAEQFAPQPAKAKRIKSKTTPEQNYEIVYTHRMPNSDRAAFYVVKLGEKGFVIISADDVANPILGYSYTNSWPTSISAQGDTLLPPQVLSFLNNMALQIETAIEKYPNLESSEEWNNVGQKAVRKTSARKSADALPDSVGPLLTTTWGQGQYYNALCPEDANGEDGHVQTGCVATAMAQIIHYWGQKEDIKTRGIHSYDSQYGNLTVNYDSTSYDFTNMPDALTAESTPEQINAVAKLMYECGVAVNMQYDTWASGAYNEDVPSALINHFAFAYTLGLASRTLYSNVEWKDSLRANIQRGEPICYSGNDVFASHAFVLDGYTHNDYFHFNFGWNGDADGWYLIDAINPSYGFNYWQTAIMGIRPNQDLQTVICHSGHSQLLNKHQFNVTEPIDVYSYRKGSNYIAINERLSKSFVTFTPEDSSEQLVLDMLEIDKDQAIVVYDGASGDSLVRVINTRSYHHYEGDASDTVFQNMAGTDFSPIVSTRHGLKIVTYSNERLPYGFHLRVSNASDCRMVSNLQIHETADGFHVSWKNNGDATSWQVKVGNDIYTCDTTYIQLQGLSPNTSYTIQVRSVCGENYSSWNSIEVNKRVYWTDLVKSEPDGYFLNGDTIHITSSEGLAWISHIVDSLYWKYEDNQNLWEFEQDPYLYKVISIENDLNLGDYQWTTIREWRGHVCGDNHVINNLNSENLFGNIFDANISDVSFQNSNLNVIANAGAIAGSIHNCTVRNCSSINYRISSSESNNGGLFGNATDSKIINCYAYGEMYGLLGFGGLIGVSYNSEILNCVTSLGESFNWSEVIDGHTWRGLITERFNNGAIDNCFADINKAKRSWGDDNDPEYVRLAKRAYFLGDVQEVGSIENLAVFNSTNTQGLLLADTAVNYTLADHKNVVDALNDYVKRQNDSTLRTWRWDEDLNLPVLDAFYQVTCPNVSDIQAENIAYQDGFAVVLSWKENGDAQEWQVKYKITNQPDSTTKMFTTNTTIDTIKGLTLGEEYTFFVRPICDIADTIGWGNSHSFFVDKIYWKDVVRSRPEGFHKTENGNILISSAEGLVWFANNDFLWYGDTLFILKDIDMGGYRWSPMREFYGVIEGGGHIISNIYCNENINNTSSSEIGFISYASNNTTIQNLIIKNSSFIGNNRVGSIFGIGYDVNIINCQVINTEVRGVSYVGGLGGFYLPFNDACKISNCSVSGIIYGDNNTGGLVGEHWRATISNCYTNCNILPSNIRTTTNQVGGLMGYSSGKVYNCYSTSQLNVELQYAIGTLIGQIGDGEYKFIYAQQNKQISQIGGIGGVDTIIADTSSFINNQLQSAITIGNSSYTNLLEALNAWVDANNSEGQYLHWVADTANVNGGYPIFRQEPIALPKYIITFCNDDGTILQQDTLELGEMPEYRGGIPTKDSTEQYNYTFIGWDQELVPVTKNVTYHAQYEETLNQYEINFYDWDGTLLQSEWVNYGEWPTYYNSDPWRESDAQYTYNFTGWSPQLDWVTGHQSYYAQYTSTLNQYEITFYDWDGSLLYSEMFDYGEYPVYGEPANPEREADAQFTYTFTGWDSELSEVTGVQSYTAQYESTLNQYEVTFYNWDGSVHYSGIFNYGDWPVCGEEFGEPTRPSDAQYTYTFTGWGDMSVVTGAQSYAAQYEATLNQYEVTFYNWNGEVLQSSMVNYGEMPVYNSATPTRESDAQYTYTFTGWGDMSIVTGSQSYTAQYESTLNQYEVTFYNWDGSVLQSTMVNYGEMPSYNSAIPTREADAQYTYTFIGWDSELNVVTGAQSYTAQYESTLNQYEVTFLNWDGEVLQSTMVNYGEMPVYNSAIPTREADAQYTYTFTGWGDMSIVIGNQSYTAQYESTLNQYEVTFYNWDGEVLQSTMVNYGEMPVYNSATPTRESDAQYTYTFTGWGDMSIVTGSQSYTAQYESTLNQYEVTFYNWDGTLLQSSMVNYGEMPSYNSATPTREADAQYTYTFTGWGDMSIVTGSQSYTAQYESTLNQYEVTFYNWNGSVHYSGIFNYGDWPVCGEEFGEPTRPSDAQYTYTFTGWGDMSVVTGAQSYAAQYEATLNQYEVTFYNWNGEVLQSSMVNYGEMPVYNSATPTRESDAQYTYTFTGWGDMSIVTGSQSYTAHYESTLNQYEVTFYNWDGTLLQSSMVNYGEMPSYNSATPTREADAQYTYTFTGWGDMSIVTGSQSYTAQYESTLNQYEVTFYNWNGSVHYSGIFNYGDWPVCGEEFGEPTRPSDAQYTYTFTGWGDMSVVTGAQSYAAQYEATLNQYEVTFYNWNGEVLQSSMVNYGEMPVYNSATPTRESDAQYTYTFTGWGDMSIVTGSQSYTAHYESTLNQYEVTFYNWNGTWLQSDWYYYGDYPSYIGATPTRESDAQYTYTFTGWGDMSIVTGSQSYTAQYEATLNQYEVTFYNWNGEVLQSSMINYGEMPVYNSATPTRESDAQYTYTFTGWGDMSVVTGAQSYAAQYEATLNQYEVTFLNWDGTLLQSTMVNYGEMPVYTGATPTRESDAQYTYTFTGWSPELSEVVDDQEYTAQYDAIENDPTSMDEVSAETIKPRKVLIDEKVYIIVGETIYSAQGQKIR